MPTPPTNRELPFEEIMTRAVEAEGEDEAQMRSLMPPEKASTEVEASMPPKEEKVEPAP